MINFNQYQYDDLLNRSQDTYANTKYEIILRLLRNRTNLRILNVGCGSGELCFQLARAGHRVVGIDPGAEYIAVAKKNLERMPGLDCRFEVSTVESWRATEPFDCVMATDVLEHIEDDVTAFNKMADLVKPGGELIITVPAGQWLFGYHDVSLGHFRRYSLGMVRSLVSSRCRVEHLRYFGFSLIPVCLLYSKLLRKPYPVAESGDSRKRPLLSRALNSLLQIDSRVPMPLGTSVIMHGVRT